MRCNFKPVIHIAKNFTGLLQFTKNKFMKTHLYKCNSENIDIKCDYDDYEYDGYGLV